MRPARTATGSCPASRWAPPAAAPLAWGDSRARQMAPSPILSHWLLMVCRLLIGSGRSEEWRQILQDRSVELRDLTSFPGAPEVEEDGKTFEDNARKKAAELARHLGQWVLGEDSGLVVPGLNGRPGVYSARYAGKQGDDAANNARLLAELAALTPPTPPSQGGENVCSPPFEGGAGGVDDGREAYYV